MLHRRKFLKVLFNMNTITRDKLLKAGFTVRVINGVNVYTRDGYSFIHNNVGWCPCKILLGEVKIGNIRLDTMEDIERYIIETKNM